MTAFGDRVKVTAQAVAIYGIATEVYGPAVYGPAGSRGLREGTGKYRVQSFEIRGQPQPPGEDGGWPGLAVPDPDGVHARRFYSPGLEPVEVEGRGNHRRIRRLPLSESGVVVGNTWRQEGTYDAGSGVYYGEPQEPCLVEIRRLRVVQVAIDTKGPARVVDVWHEDVVPT